LPAALRSRRRGLAAQKKARADAQADGMEVDHPRGDRKVIDPMVR